MTSAAKPGRSLTATLERLTRDRKGGRIKLGELIGEIEADAGPGPVLFVLTLPELLPTAPGVSPVLALPLLLVAPQIIAGRRKVWVPKWLAERTIEREKLAKLANRLIPLLAKLERLVRPRLEPLTGRVGARIVGLAATAMAIVLILPIPLANLVPSLAILLFAVGLARRDGLVVIAGYGVVALAVVVIWLVVAGFRFGLARLGI